MGIAFIIIGSILFAIFGFLYLSTYLATKNQKNWDEFYNQLTEKNNLPVPEEAVYSMVSKMRLTFGCVAALGLISLLGGILIQVL